MGIRWAIEIKIYLMGQIMITEKVYVVPSNYK